MSNIIALVWDFDKTLINGYMEDPIFEHYNVDSKKFWIEVNDLPRKYQEEQNVQVNKDTIYLNHFINYAKSGKFKDLNNEKLKSFGKELNFYSGVFELFEKTKNNLLINSCYKEHNIKVEHYIVSTGLKKVIEGSKIMQYVDGVWGCEFIEAKDNDGKAHISEIGYTIDNTSKTRALFEINKGVNRQDINVEVNTKIPENMRRVHFINMVYVADGPSDIPAFSVVNKNGGSTFAVYPKGDKKAMKQVEMLREEGRIKMYAEANYSEGTTADMWICNTIINIADKIVETEKDQLSKVTGKGIPQHLI